MGTNVVIVHRNSVTARGLALILERYSDLQVVAEVSDTETALAVIREKMPDLILVDSEISELDLDATIASAKFVLPEASIAVLTGTDDWSHLSTSIRAGATSFVSMKTDPEELALCLRLVSDGHVLVSSPLVSSLSDLVQDDPGSLDEKAEHELSNRELEILGHVVHGLTNLEISQALTITENTVKVHMRNILGKLQLRNRQQAAAYALKTGLVSDEEFRDYEA